MATEPGKHRELKNRISVVTLNNEKKKHYPIAPLAVGLPRFRIVFVVQHHVRIVEEGPCGAEGQPGEIGNAEAVKGPQLDIERKSAIGFIRRIQTSEFSYQWIFQCFTESPTSHFERDRKKNLRYEKLGESTEQLV